MQYGRKIPSISKNQIRPKSNQSWIIPITTALCTAIFTGLVTSVLTSFRISEEFNAWQKKELIGIERERYQKKLDDIEVLHEKFYQMLMSMMESRSNEVSFYFYEYMKEIRPEYIFGKSEDINFQNEMNRIKESQKKLYEHNVETTPSYYKNNSDFQLNMAYIFYTQGSVLYKELSKFRDYYNNFGKVEHDIHNIIEEKIKYGANKRLPEQDLYNSIIRDPSIRAYTNMAELDRQFNVMIGKLYEYNAEKLQNFESALAENRVAHRSSIEQQ